MVENTLVKEQLTPEMIDIGGKLLTSAEAVGMPVSAAFWLFDRETNTWQLKIASPVTTSKGQREAYRLLADARNSLGLSSDDFPLDTIGVLTETSELLSLFRQAVRTGEELSRIRFSRNWVNGHYIDDALIYRVH